MRAGILPRSAWAALVAVAALGVVGGSVGASGHSSGPRPSRAAEGACKFAVDKRAEPDTALLGGEIGVTLTAQVRCAGGATMSAVLVMDSSLDMGGTRMAHARESVTAFADAVGLGPARVGLVAYSGYVEALSPLTSDRDALERAAARLFPRPGSDLAGGLRSARQVLQQGRPVDQPPGLEAVVVLAGSAFDGPAEDVLAAAEALRGDGAAVAVVAYGGNADVAMLEQIASSRDLFVVEGLSHRLPEVFAELGAELGQTRPVSASVVDELPDGMTYVWGSGQPAPRVRGRELSWSYAVWPSEGIAVTYAVTPSREGRQATNVRAEITVTFDRGEPEVRVFPVPVVDVVREATATSTATSTAASTATPTGGASVPPGPSPTDTATTGPTTPTHTSSPPGPTAKPLFLPAAHAARSAVAPGEREFGGDSTSDRRPPRVRSGGAALPSAAVLRPDAGLGYSAGGTVRVNRPDPWVMRPRSPDTIPGRTETAGRALANAPR